MRDERVDPRLMGTSRSAAELAAKMHNYADAIPNANRVGVAEAALLMKNTIQPLMAAATGGDLRLSGMNNARIGVRYDLRGTTNPTALVRATGPAHIVERDVKPHTVVPKRTARRTSRRARIEAVESGNTSGITGVLRFRDGTFARYAKLSGGSKGRHPFGRGVDIASRRTGEQFRRAHRRALLTTFR
jgi:hypothetical protein